MTITDLTRIPGAGRRVQGEDRGHAHFPSAPPVALVGSILDAEQRDALDAKSRTPEKLRPAITLVVWALHVDDRPNVADNSSVLQALDARPFNGWRERADELLDDLGQHVGAKLHELEGEDAA